ncbi:chemotaxis protein CheA [Aliidiomarina sedimenti]|uniref:Chemotaxis protein CheA n=1 Tax=Aliidiomarina sedimenti TaxID=1933879 RepID=A0ABY0C283_9GAMM|nr:chemotaxis protein CheA [Aliidiomarina sedimenti]RUO31912.1 chemotaxis protein CheA [Aliidiomarina sedimenti]
MSMDAALITYVEECRELLEQMEGDLLALERGLDTSDDSTTETEDDNEIAWCELINRIFRSAHTVKGSAGVFGLDHIVEFTHEVETLLDQLREEKITLTSSLIATLLECKDHCLDLIECLADGVEEESNPQRAERLVNELQTFSPPAEKDNQSFAVSESNNNESPAIERLGNNGSGHWHISLRFHAEALREGMDPMSFLRYLQKLGQIVSVVTVSNEMPDNFEKFDPEACYLGFEIGFVSHESKQTIEDVFEFIRDDSQVRIIPPFAELESYLSLISELDQEPRRLGEILVECGSLTPEELEQALAIQSSKPQHALGEILINRGNTAPQVVEAAIAKQAQSTAGRSQNEDRAASKDGGTLRVEADRVDELINLIGELVISGASTAIHSQDSNNDALTESVSTLNELIEEVRDASMRLRMVEIGATFNRFQRVVRDVANELGKQVTLSITGADTELDKTVVEKIGDPLMHLVRNALDHGIESPAEREAKGKPLNGQLKLNAYHDSGSIVIEIIDDGAGLDAERIRAKAIEKGLIDSTYELNKEDIYKLIFAPGFSTADAVTNLSGRGVGMDVVRNNIVELGGRIDIDSEQGKGTKLTLHLPLTLAIIDGFLVGVEESPFVIPLDSIRECVELQQDDAVEKNGRQYMNLRNEVLPFVRLRELFGMKTERPIRENVVVVHYGNQKAGIVVDRLHGELQTVIKPLGQLFSQLQGIGGSSIMGNGEVALILDIPTLMQLVKDKQPHHVIH